VSARSSSGLALQVSDDAYEVALFSHLGGTVTGKGLPPLRLTRGLGGSGRGCGLFDCLKFDRREMSESTLTTLAVVGPFDPGDYRQS
jgi:hypothetical protein